MTQINTEGGTSIGGNVDSGGGAVVGHDLILQVASPEIGNINTLVAALQNSIANKDIDKKELFEHHIQPAFDKLELINKDYEQTIFELKKQFTENAVESEKLTEWIEGRSLQYEDERIYLKNIKFELKEVSAKELDDKKVACAIMRFARAVTQYFDFNHDNVTIYNYLETNLIPTTSIQDPKTKTVVIQKDWIESTLKYLDSAWEKVVCTYLGLKGLCLA